MLKEYEIEWDFETLLVSVNLSWYEPGVPQGEIETIENLDGESLIFSTRMKEEILAYITKEYGEKWFGILTEYQRGFAEYLEGG